MQCHQKYLYKENLPNVIQTIRPIEYKDSITS